MESVSASTGASSFRPFITNGGPHSVETTTAMSMHSLVDINSNPIKAAAVRAQLEDLYAQARTTIHFMFSMVADEKTTESRDVMKRAIIQILVRDFNTLLDIERQIHKD